MGVGRQKELWEMFEEAEDIPGQGMVEERLKYFNFDIAKRAAAVRCALARLTK